MANRFSSSRTGILFRASKELVRINPSLLWYEVLYVPVLVASVLISLAPALWHAGYLQAVGHWLDLSGKAPVPAVFWPWAILGLCVGGVLCMAVAVARYVATDAALRGERMPMLAALAVARKRLGRIAQWSVLGYLGGGLSLVPGLDLFDWILAGLIQTEWGIRTLFAFPILASRDMGPFAAAGYSAKLVRSAWPGSGRAGYGLGILSAVVTALGLGAAFLMVVGTATILSSTSIGMAAGIATLILVWLVGLTLVLWAGGYVANLQAAFVTALFRYAETGDYVGPFPHEFLEHARLRR